VKIGVVAFRSMFVVPALEIKPIFGIFGTPKMKNDLFEHKSWKLPLEELFHLRICTYLQNMGALS
jgi:hypothetical protein